MLQFSLYRPSMSLSLDFDIFKFLTKLEPSLLNVRKCRLLFNDFFIEEDDANTLILEKPISFVLS